MSSLEIRNLINALPVSPQKREYALLAAQLIPQDVYPVFEAGIFDLGFIEDPHDVDEVLSEILSFFCDQLLSDLNAEMHVIHENTLSGFFGFYSKGVNGDLFNYIDSSRKLLIDYYFGNFSKASFLVSFLKPESVKANLINNDLIGDILLKPKDEFGEDDIVFVAEYISAAIHQFFVVLFFLTRSTYSLLDDKYVMFSFINDDLGSFNYGELSSYSYSKSLKNYCLSLIHSNHHFEWRFALKEILSDLRSSLIDTNDLNLLYSKSSELISYLQPKVDKIN